MYVLVVANDFFHIGMSSPEYQFYHNGIIEERVIISTVSRQVKTNFLELNLKKQKKKNELY